MVCGDCLAVSLFWVCPDRSSCFSGGSLCFGSRFFFRGLLMAIFLVLMVLIDQLSLSGG